MLASMLSRMLVCGAALALAAEPANVTVVTTQLPLEQEHALQVDSATEHILLFVPTAEQSEYPLRVWARVAGGHLAAPVLLTARHYTGAQTWQLPYSGGRALLYELERTLCVRRDDQPAADTDCEGEEGRVRGQVSLHVSSACAAPLALALRVDVARDWLLPREPAHITVTQTAARMRLYSWAEGEQRVRLVAASDDDVCATLAVQHYECPLVQTPEDIAAATVHMTMQRSGGVQLSRSVYPRGFVVVGVVGADDTACGAAPEPAADWLWAEAAGAAPEPAARAPAARTKRIRLHLEAALTRAQYVWGAGAALAVFGGFYAAFGALLLAARWPRCRRLVEPRAVLADPAETERGVRRRASDATFDSSDISDTDSEEEDAAAAPPPDPAPAPPSPAIATIQLRSETAAEAAAEAEAGASRAEEAEAGASRAEEARRPFGLPAQLRLAALSRRRGRVLRARSDRYLQTLYTVAVFYALPVVQFVAAFQMMLNVSGSLDLCYYNFLCAHPLGALSDFNHVYSNVGYLLLGALFLLQVRRRRARRRVAPRHALYGIPQHYGLLSSLGAGMMVVAVLSASYHVCPNALNFQFDTAFMYVLAVLSMVKIYQSRHPDINARAHATFAVLALLILLVVWGVLGGGPLFWSVFSVLHVFIFLLLSLQIYYVGQFRLEKRRLAETARAVVGGGVRPLYSARLAALLLANAVNWAFALYGLAVQPADIASHLLFVLLGNALLYVVWYLAMKLLHGERPRWYSWAAAGGAAAAWAPALYLFAAGSTDWAAAPAQSRHLNHECRVLRFYDSHDLWHMLSAAALYGTFTLLLTWDDGLSAVRRTDIAVF